MKPYGSYIRITLDVGASCLHGVSANNKMTLLTWLEEVSGGYAVKARTVLVDDPYTISVADELVLYTDTYGESVPLIPFPLGNNYFCIPMQQPNSSLPLAYIVRMSPFYGTLTLEGSIPDGATNNTGLRPSGFGTFSELISGPNASCLIYHNGMCWITTTSDPWPAQTGTFTFTKQAHIDNALDLRDSLVNGYDYWGDSIDESGSANLFTADGKAWEIDSTTNTITLHTSAPLTRDAIPDVGSVAWDSNNNDIVYAYLYKVDGKQMYGIKVYDFDTTTAVAETNDIPRNTAFENSIELVDHDIMLDDENGTFVAFIGNDIIHFDPATNTWDSSALQDNGFGIRTSGTGSSFTKGNGAMIAAFVSNIEGSIYVVTFDIVGDVNSGPVYPDGPLWYVGGVDGWVSGFVWDGNAWQPCRMTDGTLWWDGPPL